MKTDKTPAIFLRGRRSPYHNLSTRIPASFHVFLDGVPFLYFRESARVQSFKCCIVLTRAQMEIHHVLFTASKKHYTLPPVPQRRRRHLRCYIFFFFFGLMPLQNQKNIIVKHLIEMKFVASREDSGIVAIVQHLFTGSSSKRFLKTILAQRDDLSPSSKTTQKPTKIHEI
jgi:hypothetical protein